MKHLKQFNSPSKSEKESKGDRIISEVYFTHTSKRDLINPKIDELINFLNVYKKDLEFDDTSKESDLKIKKMLEIFKGIE